MTLGLGLVALASPVLLFTDPIRQRDMADRLSPPTHRVADLRPVPARH